MYQHITDDFLECSPACNPTETCLHKEFPIKTELKSKFFFSVLGFSLFETFIRFANTKYSLSLGQGLKILQNWTSSSLVLNIQAFEVLQSEVLSTSGDYLPSEKIRIQREDFNRNPHKLNIVSDFVKVVLMYYSETNLNENLFEIEENQVNLFLQTFCKSFNVYVKLYPEGLIFTPEVYELRPIIYLHRDQQFWSILQHRNVQVVSQIEFFSGLAEGLVYQPGLVLEEDFHVQHQMDENIIEMCRELNKKKKRGGDFFDLLLKTSPHLMNSVVVRDYVSSNR